MPKLEEIGIPNPFGICRVWFERIRMTGCRMSRKHPTRAQHIRAIRECMRDKGDTYLGIANALGKSVGSLHRVLNDPKVSDDTFNSYLIDLQPLYGYRSSDEWDDHVLLQASGGYPARRNCLEFGDTSTLWYPAIKSFEPGQHGFSGDYSIQFRNDIKVEIDSDLAEAVAITKAQHRQGDVRFENGELLYMLAGGSWFPFSEPDQRSKLRIEVCTHEYALFFTLTSTEHGRVLLKQRLRKWQKGQIVPALSGGLGINVSIVAADGAFILGRRRKGDRSGPRQGQLEVGAAEGLSVQKDLLERGFDLSSQPKFDIDFVIRRALHEEYGILSDEINEIRILGFGYDLQYSQWNILAMSIVDIDGKRILRRHKSAQHGEEFLETFSVQGSATSVFNELVQEQSPVWSCGLALAYYSMINLHGLRAVEEAVEGMDLRPQELLV